MRYMFDLILSFLIQSVISAHSDIGTLSSGICFVMLHFLDVFYFRGLGFCVFLVLGACL